MESDDITRKSPPGSGEETVAFRTAPNSAAGTPLSGTLLKDRYLFIRPLGHGGFGAVYLAQDKQMHDRLVVVKIQADRPTEDPWFDRKFSEEVRALSMIDHPGVVVAIDSGRTPEGQPFLVMQFVDGATLRTILNSEGMPLDRAAAIIKQVGNALGAAHDRGILHRDLKPENLMLQTLPDGSERVRLIDFGIASVADENKFQTSTRVSGTVLYMAPEQWEGRVSEMTDIYAMGLIAYEMVTGRRPFIAENSVHLANLQRAGVRVKPSDLRPALPRAAERLILKSLEYEPSKRPPSARDFGDQLQEALLDSGTRAAKPKAEARKGRSGAVSLVSALVAIAFVLAGGAYWKLRSHPAPAEVTPPKALSSTNDAAIAKDAAITKDARPDPDVELAFWESVKQSSDPQFYREYLAKYPQGRFASLAKLNLEILAKKAAEKPANARAQSANDTREDADDDIWNVLQKTADPKLYRQYLDAYPAGRYAKQARKKAKQSGDGPEPPPTPGAAIHLPGVPDLGNLPGVNPNVSAELSYWNKLKDAKDAQPFRDYLTKYPNGMFASLARMKIAAFDKAADQ